MEQSTLSTQDQEEILRGWDKAQFDLQGFQQFKRKGKAKEKNPEDLNGAEAAQKQGETGFAKPRTGWFHTKHMTYDQRKQLHAEKEAWKRGYVQAPVGGDKTTEQGSEEDAELEKAIQASVQETSRGNPEEDAAVESAIRQSITAMQVQGAAVPGGRGDSKLDKKDATIFEDADYKISDEEYQNLIQQAMQQSMSGSDYQSPASHEQSTDTGKASVAKGTSPSLPPRNVDPEQDEYERAVAASKEDMDRGKSPQTEEDIVMEYVKKQSLAEEEYRKKLSQGKGSNEEHDEELKRAMEESMKLGKDGAA